MDKEFDVRILGGSRAAELVLNKRPSNWTVYEFGSLPPTDFLAEIDFWVYFHHPHTLEAYGRAIMEALDSGCVVILPSYLEPTFGAAAVYAEPSEVREVVRQFSADRDKFIAQSTRGQNFARKMGPEIHTDRLATYGIQPRTKDASAEEVSASEAMGLRRVLFLTSNGAGMGHLTRLLAIARASNKERVEPFFLSLSQGVPVVAAQGFPFEYIASSGAMAMPAPEWNEYLLERLRQSVRVLRPAAIVFDGTVPYVGLVKFLQESDLVKVWIRRGMWKKDASGKSLSRESNFDLVIEPGEYAHDYDEGPTSSRDGQLLVNPITVLEAEETLSREDARAHMGMAPDEKSVLLTMGAGNINDIGDIQDAILQCFARSHPEWQVYVTKPPIAESIGKSSLNVLETYPLARIARAFDFAISAAGYNSFHEWTSMQIPTLWIPNEQTSVDDQLGRARWAQDEKVGLCFSGRPGESLVEQIARLVDDETRDSMRTKMASLVLPDGARAAATAIMEGLGV
ncbi:hypothetical protein AYX22_16780 [Arthrobacter sp. D5-1]|nr:hypothetical protein AYX22_16780 [Arthrobacter sp. D5-1]